MLDDERRFIFIHSYFQTSSCVKVKVKERRCARCRASQHHYGVLRGVCPVGVLREPGTVLGVAN